MSKLDEDPFVRLDKEEFLTPYRINNIKNKIKYDGYLKASEDINHHWESIIAVACGYFDVSEESDIKDIINKIVGYLPIGSYNASSEALYDAIDYEIRKEFIYLPNNFIDEDFMIKSRMRYLKVYLTELFRCPDSRRYDTLILKQYEL